MNNLIINKEDSVAVMIDYQEKLLPAMRKSDELLETVVKLCKGLTALNVPVIATEQYPKGLGSTVEGIKEVLVDTNPIEKVTFSAYRTEEFAKEIKETGKKTVILFGIESHICVMQTAFELLEDGYKVYVVEDACRSRSKVNHKSSMSRMQNSGVVVTTYESVLYELTGAANAEGFKEISKIVK